MVVDALADVLTDAVHVLVLVFGLGFVWHAATVWSHRRSLSKAGTIDTGSVPVERQVGVEGEIRGPVDSQVVSPFDQTKGVLVKWKVSEFMGHEAAQGGGWTEVASGYEAVPFLVDDGSGPVAVEVSGEESMLDLELELESFGDDPAIEVDVTERPPRRVREFLEANDVRDRQSETSAPTTEGGDEQGDRRYYETVLRRGDDVYVVGYASERDDGGADVTLSPSSDGTFYLSDRSRTDALRQRTYRVAVMGVLGVLLVWFELSRFVPGVSFVNL